MRVLVVGSGGREHALCWRISQCPSVSQVLAIPGNPGIAEVAECHDIPIDNDGLVAFCNASSVDLVVIGPERPLIAGLADALRDANIAVFGPSAECAQIEGSKAFAKRVMQEEGIPTARYESFSDASEAIRYIETESSAGRRVVVKASGDALGKGVIVAKDKQEAIHAVEQILDERIFGDAGETVVVEEQLTGEEASLLAICSGSQYRLLPTAKDYKAAFDGGVGPNTGGIGAVSPGPTWAEALGEQFIAPVLNRFVREGTPFVGTLFCGLMNTPSGTMALEYNARFGDPETQAILPRIEGDFAQMLFCAATSAPLPEMHVRDEACVCLVITASGYPGEYRKGEPIPAITSSDVAVFHAGTRSDGGVLVSNGGRVIGITSIAATIDEARRDVYEAAKPFENPNWHFRTDIGE